MHLHIVVEVHLKSALEFTMTADSTVDTTETMIEVMIEDMIVGMIAEMTDRMIIEAMMIETTIIVAMTVVHLRNDTKRIVTELITTITGKLSDAF